MNLNLWILILWFGYTSGIRLKGVDGPFNGFIINSVSMVLLNVIQILLIYILKHLIQWSRCTSNITFMSQWLSRHIFNITSGIGIVHFLT